MRLFLQRAPTKRMGILGEKPFPAVNMTEEVRQSERFDNRARGMDGLVGKYCHTALSSVDALNGCECLRYTGINPGMVEFVHAVVAEKVLQGLFDEGFIPRITEGT